MAKQQRIIVGQVAAITGGGRGIGQATARALVREGVKVAIGDIDFELAQAAAEELGSAAIAVKLDVTDPESFADFISATEEQLGPVDIIINNAGIMQLGPFLDEDLATTKRMIDINIYGVHYGCKLTLPKMLQRGRGHIVNVASSAGKGGYPGGASYCGTKHYVVGMSEALRWETRGTGVEVSCVMPVVVQTELGSGLPQTRGVKHVLPEDVANEIVSALKEPRFDVFVPRSAGAINQVAGVLPRRGREAIIKAVKGDKVLMDIDLTARRDYELRAASKSTTAEMESGADRQLEESKGS
ncbi:MAG: SDR family oxidoreductase [Solirubrobacteraceae bacterium]|jgi:NADP-dependent 3-hydroxy acid dehydrogenase YdfG|nr:SDR family oxidoreductase [Solirubrobacteraceae bacterium]